LNAFIWFGLQP